MPIIPPIFTPEEIIFTVSIFTFSNVSPLPYPIIPTLPIVILSKL